MQRRTVGILGVLIGLWLLPLRAQYSLQRTVFPSAAGSATNSSYTLLVTFGEPLSGSSTTGSQAVTAGFLLPHREIEIVAPTTGTVWYTGVMHTIRWNWIGQIARVTIELSTDGGSSWSTITSNIVNTGGYQWTPTQTASQARIRVSDTYAPAIRAESGNFTLLNPGPASITVTYPSSSAVLFAGSVTTITWSWTGVISSVDLFFSSDGGQQWATIATAVTNTGNYPWHVPDDPTVVGKIRVQQHNNASVQGTSASFEIRSTSQTAVHVAMYLEGPLNATTGSMQTLLEQSGYLPTTQPYSRWGYNGTEQRASWLSGIVDWVLIEIRSTNQTVIATTAGLLRSDGQVYDEGGYPQVLVPTTVLPAGNYYVVIRHRNHIAAMSSTATALSIGSSALYDFRTAMHRAYQQFAAGQKSIGNVAALVAGDAWSDGIINARDRVKSRQQLFQTGYQDSDVNLDGTVNATDRTVIRNNTFWVTQVP